MLPALLTVLSLSAAPAEPLCAWRQEKHLFEVEYETGMPGRALKMLRLMREKSGYKEPVHLYASLFDEAYSWIHPCTGAEIIVIYVGDLNTMKSNVLNGLMGHEFGHKIVEELKARVPKTAEDALKKIDEQNAADGAALELISDEMLWDYYVSRSWDKRKATERIRDGKRALAALRALISPAEKPPEKPNDKKKTD